MTHEQGRLGLSRHLLFRNPDVQSRVWVTREYSQTSLIHPTILFCSIVFYSIEVRLTEAFVRGGSCDRYKFRGFEWVSEYWWSTALQRASASLYRHRVTGFNRHHWDLVVTTVARSPADPRGSPSITVLVPDETSGLGDSQL
jgi:hypothetical protein